MAAVQVLMLALAHLVLVGKGVAVVESAQRIGSLFPRAYGGISSLTPCLIEDGPWMLVLIILILGIFGNLWRSVGRWGRRLLLKLEKGGSYVYLGWCGGVRPCLFT